jgi:dienelactone hydrolase
MSHRSVALALVGWLLWNPTAGSIDGVAVSAAELDVRAAGESIPDSRLGPLKDLDGYFPFEPSQSAEAWEARARQRRIAMQVALGIWPPPEKTPLNAVVHGRRDMGGYTVEKVYFESLPGFYVTGNLYRPQGAGGKRPAVLCPHGHFTDGRFGDAGAESARREIVAGAERFENGGRNQIQARCAQLARMGCVVFNYDMIGYCDSVQLSFDLAHRFAKQRPDMNSPESWGLFSPQAESALQSVLGLQAWNSIRALDWISELPDVDAERIAVTGASGGGTQTFILGAIDLRPAALIPAVMVSTAMQGGCTCENASLLRVGTGNIEFAALIAPRPLCLISANDWTREMPTKGYPELKRHYAMLGVGDRIEHTPLLHFGHNYNFVSRSVMYQFVNRRFELGLPEPVIEDDFPRLTKAELTVWDDEHPAPETGPQVERQILRTWWTDAQQQLAALRPRDKSTAEDYRQLVGPALDAIIGRRVPSADRIEFQQRDKRQVSDYLQVTGLLHHRPAEQDPGHGEAHEILPVAFFIPEGWEQGPVAIWVDVRGKNGLLSEGKPRPEVRRLLDRQVAVIGVDLLEQGELVSGSEPLAESRRVENPREAAAYTMGYNRALFAQRVHDLLTVISFAAHHPRSPSQIWLIGRDGAGPWVAAARAQADRHVDRAIVDTGAFRFLNVTSIRDPQFLPGGAKYDDLPGMLAVAAPQPLWLSGESPSSAQWVRDAYAAVDASDQFHLAGDDEDVNDALDWLGR